MRRPCDGKTDRGRPVRDVVCLVRFFCPPSLPPTTPPPGRQRDAQRTLIWAAAMSFLRSRECTNSQSTPSTPPASRPPLYHHLHRQQRRSGGHHEVVPHRRRRAPERQLVEAAAAAVGKRTPLPLPRPTQSDTPSPPWPTPRTTAFRPTASSRTGAPACSKNSATVVTSAFYEREGARRDALAVRRERGGRRGGRSGGRGGGGVRDDRSARIRRVRRAKHFDGR